MTKRRKGSISKKSIFSKFKTQTTKMVSIYFASLVVIGFVAYQFVFNVPQGNGNGAEYGSLNVLGYYNNGPVACSNVYYNGPSGSSAPINIPQSGYTWLNLLSGSYTVYGTYQGATEIDVATVPTDGIGYAELVFSGTPSNDLVVWVSTDMHCGSTVFSQIATNLFQQSVTDANTIGYDYTVAMGDMVRDGTTNFWSAYTSTRASTIISTNRWYEVVGNHDFDDNKYSNTITRFQQATGDSFYYSKTVGNLLLIFMGDQKGATVDGSLGTISDETFTWFQNTVSLNPGKNIFVFTHQPLYNTLPSTTFGWTHILDSERFTSWLQSNPNVISAWFSGHLHAQPSSSLITYKYGTYHVSTGPICGYYVEDPGVASTVAPPQSRFLFFTEGSDQMLIRMRNHQSQTWYNLDYTITMAHNFLQ